MDNLWSSSGRFSQDSLHWESSIRFNRWDSKRKNEICENSSKTVQKYARRFPGGHWSFVGPGAEKKWYGTYDTEPDGSWDRNAESMTLNFAQTEQFQCFGERRKKKQRKWEEVNTLQWLYAKHRVASPDGRLHQSAQYRRSSSGYDLRITSWSESSGGKPSAPGQLDKQEIPTQPPLGEVQANEERLGNLLQEYEQRFETLSEDQQLSRLCSEAGLR